MPTLYMESGLHGAASLGGESFQYFSPIIPVFKPFDHCLCVNSFRVCWFCWQNTSSDSVSSCAAVMPPLEKMPMTVPVSTLTISYSCCNTARFESGLFLGQQGYHPGVPSSLLNDSSLHHIPHVSAKQISLHWLSFQSLPRRTAFLQPGHRKGLCL